MRWPRRRAGHPAVTFQQRLARWAGKFEGLGEDDRWAVRQAISAPARYYGNGGTIHQTSVVNVEVDAVTGEIVSLWYRCQMLPFDVSAVKPDRADEMRAASAGYASKIRLTGVEVLDGEA